jgi:phosphate-selective porin
MGNPTTVTVRQPVSAVSALQDLFITFLTPYADVSLGQFKIPVSWEGYNSSGRLLMPERAPVAVQFGDKRDLGIRIAKTFPKWGYSAGVFNGTGLNNLDNNNQKDVALRLEVYPVKGLTLAGLTYDSIGYRQRAGTKDRWEADVRYEGGPYLVQAEYLRARDITKDGADAVTGQGFYVAAGYTIKKTPLPLHGDLQPVVRVGYLDQDTSQNVPVTGADELVHYDVGINYYLRAHEMKLQAFYQRQQFDDKPANNQAIVSAQINY